MKTKLVINTKGHDEWLTPPHIINSLGEFDMDPCAPTDRPWDIAKKHYTKKDNGLSQIWRGRVWCNPPYGKETSKWMVKMADHNDGILLIFARTDTNNFHSYVWSQARGIFFIKGRITFCDISGKPAKYNAGAPSCLVAYGEHNADLLKNCSLTGKFLAL